MTVLRDGTVVNESITAHNFTKAVNVPAVFKCGPRKILAITIHHWGLPGQLHDAVVRYLASANDRGSSAHVIISAGRATSIVSPFDAAWHAGNALGQTTTIGLELRPEASDADYVTAAAYIAMLWEEFGYLPLVKHSSWKATACPGKWDLARLERMAMAGSGSAAIAPAGETIKKEEEAMEIAKEWYDAMIQAQARIDLAATRTYYVKGDESDTIYDLTGGNVRGLTQKEWKVLDHLGFTFKVADQADVDALVAEYNEKHPL